MCVTQKSTDEAPQKNASVPALPAAQLKSELHHSTYIPGRIDFMFTKYIFSNLPTDAPSCI